MTNIVAEWLKRMFRCESSRVSISRIANGIYLKSAIGFLVQTGNKLPNRLIDFVAVQVLVTEEPSSTPQHWKRLVPVGCMWNLDVKDIKSKYFFLCYLK